LLEPSAFVSAHLSYIPHSAVPSTRQGNTICYFTIFSCARMRKLKLTYTGKAKKKLELSPTKKKASTALSVPYKNQNNEWTVSEIFRRRFRDAFPHYQTF